MLQVVDPVNGNYVATWTPQRTSSQITINANANVTGLQPAIVQLAGAVIPNNAPVLAQSSVANFYNPVGERRWRRGR